MQEIDDAPLPDGDLTLQLLARPRDTNNSGDIFGGWVMMQMDIAAEICAARRAGGRVATVAVDAMSFLMPVKVGDVVSCYTNTLEVGRSSIRIEVEVWTNVADAAVKVTEGEFVFVAIDENGRTRPIN